MEHTTNIERKVHESTCFPLLFCVLLTCGEWRRQFRFMFFCTSPEQILTKALKWMSRLPTEKWNRTRRVREIAIIPADSYFSDRSMWREGVVRGGEWWRRQNDFQSIMVRRYFVVLRLKRKADGMCLKMSYRMIWGGAPSAAFRRWRIHEDKVDGDLSWRRRNAN